MNQRNFISQIINSLPTWILKKKIQQLDNNKKKTTHQLNHNAEFVNESNSLILKSHLKKLIRCHYKMDRCDNIGIVMFIYIFLSKD